MATKHPIALDKQLFILPGDAVEDDNIGTVNFLFTFCRFWNSYYGTSLTEDQFTFTEITGSANFAVNRTSGEITVKTLSGVSDDTFITVRIAIGGMSMDIDCDIKYIPSTHCVFFDSGYDGSKGISNGTREKPFLKFNGSGLKPTPGKTYLWRRNRTYTREWTRIVSPKTGDKYPEWITFDAWGQGERPIIDGHDNIDGGTNQRFVTIGDPSLSNKNIKENLAGNKFRMSNFKTVHDKRNTWYPIEVKGLGDFLEFRRLAFEETTFSEGFMYLAVYTNKEYHDRKIYLESIETLNSGERSIKIEAGGVVGYNFRSRNIGATLTGHPGPGAANWPNVILKYIDSEGENISPNSLGIQCRASLHQYEWCYLKGYGYAMTVWIHTSQNGKGGMYDIKNSGYKNIIVENVKRSASFFGRHKETTDVAKAVYFQNIKLINCKAGLQVAEGAINTQIAYADLCNTKGNGIRVYPSAGPGTKIHNVTAFGNASQDMGISSSNVEVVNSNYGTLTGNPTITKSVTSRLKMMLQGHGVSLGYEYDLIGMPVPDIPSIGAYELQRADVEPTASLTSTAGGTVEGSGKYTEGASVTISAIPAPGYRFKQWSNGAADNPLTLTLVKNFEIKAVFEFVEGLKPLKTESNRQG